jgi:hypothetical protein
MLLVPQQFIFGQLCLSEGRFIVEWGDTIVLLFYRLDAGPETCVDYFSD